MKNYTKIIWFMIFHVKPSLVQKFLRIRFYKIDGFTRIYDGTRHLVLLGPKN